MAERRRHHSAALLLAGTIAAAWPLAAVAQTPGTSAKAPKPYQGPLDTIMSTRLWTNPPPMQDFVRETHPDPAAVDYTPLTGKDPDRPTPRDAAGIDALRAELEQAGEMNAARAKGGSGSSGTTKPAKPHARRSTKPVAAKPVAAKPGETTAAR